MMGIRYLTKLEDSVRLLRAQEPLMSKAASLIVDGARGGGHFFVCDQDNIVSAEAFHRSGGLVMIKQLRVWDLPRLRTSTKDVVLYFSKSRSMGGEETFIRALNQRRTKIVAVIPGRGNTGRTSFEDCCDVVIENGLDEGNGSVEAAGFHESICPMDLAINTAVVFSISAEVIGELLSRGLKPSVLMSLRRQGAREYNDRAVKRCEQQGF